MSLGLAEMCALFSLPRNFRSASEMCTFVCTASVCGVTVTSAAYLCRKAYLSRKACAWISRLGGIFWLLLAVVCAMEK